MQGFKGFDKDLKCRDFQYEIGGKCVTDKIKIVREITLSELYRDGFNLLKAHSQTTGDYAHSQTTGCEAHSQTTGYEAIACSLGINARAKAVNGWIVVVDWRCSDKWAIEAIHSAKVGGMIGDTEIKPDVWYWFKDGKLMQE